MRAETLCNQWLEMIRDNTFHDEGIITKIMIKHNMQHNIHCCISLSNYNDHLDGMRMTDEEWHDEMACKYGDIVVEWSELNNEE